MQITWQLILTARSRGWALISTPQTTPCLRPCSGRKEFQSYKWGLYQDGWVNIFYVILGQHCNIATLLGKHWTPMIGDPTLEFATECEEYLNIH